MDAGFSDSQLELRATVRDVLAKECPPSVVRESLTDDTRWRALWQTVTDLGWTGLALLDEDAGFGIVELVAVLEEVGTAAAPVPLLSSAGLAGGVLQSAGPEGLPWREQLAEGAVGVLGVAAPEARDLTPALRYADGKVRGTVGGVLDAARADLVVVIARGDDDDAVAAVLRSGAGVELSTDESVDPSRPVASLRIEASPEAVLPVSFPEALALPLTAVAADLVGLASRVLDVAVVQATTREQFDKPIGAFQAIKHRLADCYVAIERARSLTYAATMLLVDPDAPTTDTWRAAMLAKAAASDAAVDTARAGVQVHGALGMTWEHDMHLYLRRAWQTAAVLGDSRSLYRAAAASLVGAS